MEYNADVQARLDAAHAHYNEMPRVHQLALTVCNQEAYMLSRFGHIKYS